MGLRKMFFCWESAKQVTYRDYTAFIYVLEKPETTGRCSGSNHNQRLVSLTLVMPLFLITHQGQSVHQTTKYELDHLLLF